MGGAPVLSPHCHQAIVRLTDVTFGYDGRPVIEGLDFSVLERDFVALIGSNGAGKTTLLKMIVGLLKPDRGSIELFGEPASRFSRRDRIGYVPQKNQFNPLFPVTVREVVLSGLYGRRNLFRRIGKEDQAKCDDALHAMRIEDLAEKRIGELSGGQQQRAFLARALINNPALLILDEPTVGIDAETQHNFFRMIEHMHRHHRITFIMVSHDLDWVRSYMGEEPATEAGRLKFFVRHSHDVEDCVETDLAHGLKDLREAMEQRNIPVHS